MDGGLRARGEAHWRALLRQMVEVRGERDEALGGYRCVPVNRNFVDVSRARSARTSPFPGPPLPLPQTPPNHNHHT